MQRYTGWGLTWATLKPLKHRTSEIKSIKFGFFSVQFGSVSRGGGTESVEVESDRWLHAHRQQRERKEKQLNYGQNGFPARRPGSSVQTRCFNLTKQPTLQKKKKMQPESGNGAKQTQYWWDSDSDELTGRWQTLGFLTEHQNVCFLLSTNLTLKFLAIVLVGCNCLPINRFFKHNTAFPVKTHHD